MNQVSFAQARLDFEAARFIVSRMIAKVKPPRLMLVLLVLSSLGTMAQNPSPPPNAVYGAYPQNYQEIITAWLDQALLDPKSVIIKWKGEPRPGELKVQGRTIAGFLVDFTVNARNIFGAYTGAQKHTALIRDGKVVTATGFVAR